MNQIQKRLEIIKIAISMTDEETVKLQLLKLEYFENDKELSEIIVLLKQKYYAKAQSLIIQYNSNPANKYIDNQIKTQHLDPASIDNQLAESTHTENFIKLNPINKNSILNTINKNNGDKESIKNEYIHANTTSIPTKGSTTHQDISSLNNDDICINKEDYSAYVTKLKKQSLETKDMTSDKNSMTENILVEAENNISIKNGTEENKMSQREETAVKPYDKITNISTIFHNKASNHLSKPIMTVSKSATTWMKHIANGGYSDSEINKILAHINKLKNSGKHSEAAQLILICGSTESELGQLIFARELIKGDSLSKNETKAFELIKELASTGYSEAVCDYGQLIEYGIGTVSDPKYAEELYKEAVNMDSERGRRLYEAIRKKNHKFLGFFRN